MFTFCPECTTVFTVRADHLQAAGGRVRCGNCRQVYSAVDFLFEEIDVVRAAAREYRTSRLAATHRDSATQAVPEPAAEGSQPAATAVPEPADHLLALSLPGGWQQRTIAWRDVVSGAGIGLLILLLGIQWLYFNRNALAVDTRWRPTMERFCAFLQCNLPMRVDLARIELEDRDVRKHPRADQALLVNATLVNHATHTQPYPLISISFSDLSGKPVAMRYFRPAEYLVEPVAIPAGLAPGARVQALLEIEDPGRDAVSFQIDFH